MTKNRIKIESKDSDGNDIVVYVTRPTKDDNAEAQLAANNMFRLALENKAIVRKVLEARLEEQGIWDEKKEQKVKKLNENIKNNLLQLKKGGVKLSEARDLAIKVRIDRIKLTNLMSEKNEYDEFTAEAQAEAAKIDTLVSLCIKKEDGSPYFENIEKYRENSNQPFVIVAAQKLVTMFYGLDDSWESDLPENKFLSKYKFVDEDLRLVNADGSFVTIDNKRINENFQYVDEDGNPVNEDGVRIDDDGLPVVETLPFLDEDGKPIVEEVDKKPARKTKTAE